MKVYFFTADIENIDIDKARCIARLDAEIVDFYTTKLEELTLVAKYRVMPTDTLLVIDGHKQLIRLVGNHLNNRTCSIVQKLMSAYQ